MGAESVAAHATLKGMPCSAVAPTSAPRKLTWLLSRTTALQRHSMGAERPLVGLYCHAAAGTSQRDAAAGGAFSAPMGLDALDYEAGVLRDQAASMKEYAALKGRLLWRTQRAGAALAAYLLLTVSGEVAFAELAGCAASCGYLALLMREVDGLTPGTRVPLAAAERVAQQPARALALAFAAYRQALRPRLLVVVGLAAAVHACDVYLDAPLSSGIELALFAGFLSYKAALLLTLWDDLKPRSSKDGGLRPAPPQLATLPDPAAALAAEAGEPPAAEDPDDDGVVLTEDAQRAVDSILRREPRSVLKRLPRS